MNITTIAYWVSTALVSLLYLASVTFYLSDIAGTEAAIVGFGFPAYIVWVLIVVKPLGVLAILLRKPVWLAELAYAGMFFHLLLAASAHINAGDGGYPAALIGLALLLVSFFTQNAARAVPSAVVAEIRGA